MTCFTNPTSIYARGLLIVAKSPSRSSRTDRYREVLVLYLERPAQEREFALPHAGRFGYSDLKEAAPRGGYVF